MHSFLTHKMLFFSLSLSLSFLFFSFFGGLFFFFFFFENDFLVVLISYYVILMDLLCQRNHGPLPICCDHGSVYQKFFFPVFIINICLQHICIKLHHRFHFYKSLSLSLSRFFILSCNSTLG